MIRKKTAIFAITLVLLLAVFATGCTVAGDSGTERDYEIFYAKNNGKIDRNDWYALNSDGTRWENSERDRGIVLCSDAYVAFCDENGNPLFVGWKEKNILSITVDGGTKFYYSDNYSATDSISMNTVYAYATELGFTGALDDLIEAFKGASAYEVAVENGYKGTSAEWLASLVGAKGDDGAAPEIIGGYWYVGGVNTGVKATGEKGESGSYIANIEKAFSDGDVDTYTITISDGTFYSFEVKNGKNADYDLTAGELYEFLLDNGYEGGYEDFIKLFAPNVKDVSYINKALLSSVSVVARSSTVSSAGSGIIYSIDKENGDAIILTNYHVIHNKNALNGEGEYCPNIKVYLYGSEVTANSVTDAQEMGISAEYIGGSDYYDVAVLKIRESDLIKNSIATAATFTDSDEAYVGQNIIAAGNAENEGIAVTSGIVSIASENIVMQEAGSGAFVSRRVIRIDAPISPGNSGGGLYDGEGRLLGMVDAKRTETNDEGIGYAIPSNVVRAVAKNILAQYASNPTVKHKLYRPLVGMTVYVYSSQARLDETTGALYVDEKVCVDGTTAGALSDGKFEKGDFILSIKVGNGTVKEVKHVYTLTDAVMTAKVGEEITFEAERNGEKFTVTVTVAEKDMSYAE